MDTIDRGDRLVRIVNRSDNLHVAQLLEQTRQPGKRQLLVVDDKNAGVHAARSRGMHIVLRNPPPSRSGANDRAASSPKCAASRSATLARPILFPVAAPELAAFPPSSSTMIQSLSPSALAQTLTVTRVVLWATAYLTEFSMRGCRIRFGTKAS